MRYGSVIFIILMIFSNNLIHGKTSQISNETKINDASDWTSLHQAAYQGSKDMLLLLIKQDVPVNNPDKLGNTPLLLAVMNRNIDAVILLIEHGADVNKANVFGCTPEIWAAETGDKEIAGILKAHGAR